ncbi:hypothetical protein ASPWEDRAFT_169900 [Aspergillus wentii DTO 134E9]|uniref:chitinase n=1 Tax=Aspergillus wentii DTO 134E9 TaxID=1073089 RepID=A0A1L9RN87_ASPWE|nr:uncharacterized protein ASPWEDRAFT_169900 [Aspergillus wentii DTO 134E9]KAI9926033.1 hypothetical protein MW887_004492 [Aspergillus wentii]OJJ36374.1 hypothetical protein ASPWEDRAFT_169900 [Aspergillus wentii DTO 134E9]
MPRGTPPRTVVYYQTTTVQLDDLVAYIDEQPIKQSPITHLIIGCFHLRTNGYLHLNDYTPDNEHFNHIWPNMKALQERGVKVMAMIGGAAQGSFQVLDAEASFEECYNTLSTMLSDYNFNGIDLDIEETMSQAGASRLINRLTVDFGPDFEISMAPVGTALQGGVDGFSGMNYYDLEQEHGEQISFYNVQLYNGFGTMATTQDYEAIVDAGFHPSRVVAGVLTNEANGGDFVDLETVGRTVRALRAKYPDFGGVMGWEYFNSVSGGEERPYEWSVEISKYLNWMQ